MRRVVHSVLVSEILFFASLHGQETGVWHRDIPYADTENPRQTLDLAVPAKTEEKAVPLIVYVHGGAWQGGDKKGGIPHLQPFLESGNYAVASIGYRLTDEAIWPAQIHDCKAAIRWLKAHAADYGYDADKIGIWGASAGGHLVAMLGTTDPDDGLEGELGKNTGQDSSVACVVDFFGPTDFLTMAATAPEEARFDHDSPQSPESKLIGGPVQENKDKARAACPLAYVDGDEPPFLIVHGTADMLVPYNQSELLHDALEKAGRPAVLLTVRGGGHGMGFGPEVASEVAVFLEYHLLGKGPGTWRDHGTEATGMRRP